jgi:signal transduction histidine kinase
MMEEVFEVVRSAQQSLTTEQDLVSTTFEAAGRVIACSLSSVSLREQEPKNVVAVFRDVTQEAQLNRMKSEFITMAAHELRTPMTSIKGYVSLLSADTTGRERKAQQEFLQVINANVDRLMTLVNDLLDISKIEEEGLKLNLASVSLADIVGDVSIAMQKQIEAKGQRLLVDVSTKLPQIAADRDRMVQVVTNLLSNAHKYTPQDGELAIRGRQVDGHLVLDVCDAGIGISSQDQEQLFTRFFRAENAMNTEESGTGLGLAICYEIIERHGGEIQVESNLGEGSTFRILLPLDTEVI